MQHIIKHLFQADSLEEVPRERLEELVEEYPSFSMARYLLSRKLQAEDAGHFNEETQKTNLYFTNPLWLQWLLRNTAEETETLRVPPTVTEAIWVPEQSVAEPFTAVEAAEPEQPGEASTWTEDPAAPVHETISSYQEPEPSPAGEPAAETLPEEISLSAADLLLQSIAEAQQLRQSLQQVSEVHAAVTPLPPSTATPLPFIEETAEPSADNEPLRQEEANEEVKSHAGAANDENEQSYEEAIRNAEPLRNEESRVPVSIVTQSITLTEEPPPVVFESYHTIDYFASQGIKLTLDENPSDRLGRQVKSFTEWLKVMRRLPQKDRETAPDIVAEHAIQTIAAHSIEGKEILTETMAEVLIKQGMPEKAAEVYHKLSLLNPRKSAYFADKIEQLKNN